MTSNQPTWWLTMAPEEVAARILPLFSNAPFSPYMDEGMGMSEIVAWCKTGRVGESQSFPGVRLWFEDPDMWAIAEAIQVLEHARLLMRYIATETTYIGLTRRGMQVLASNTVRQHVGLDSST